MLYLACMSFLPSFVAVRVIFAPELSAGKTSPTIRGLQLLQRQFARQPTRYSAFHRDVNISESPRNRNLSRGGVGCVAIGIHVYVAVVSEAEKLPLAKAGRKTRITAALVISSALLRNHPIADRPDHIGQ